MPMIDGVIPQQNFEIIGDRIAAILAAELGNQGNLHSPTMKFVESVGLERFIPVDNTEYPFINVTFSRSDYDNKDVKTVDGYNKYYIVAYLSSPTNDTAQGDKRGALKLNRLLGLCRAILENPIYKTLGLAVPSDSISFRSTKVGSITVPKVNDNGDLLNSAMGYLEFFVKATENVILKEALPVSWSSTTVKLYNTEEGYYYKYES